MRELKFRAYVDTLTRKYMCLSSDSCFDGLGEFFNNCKDNKIMQFTGLHDKYGKELYEGDICQIFNTKNELVENGKIQFFNGTYLIGDIFTLQKIRHRVELIGNIYQNKDLLEVKNG